MADGTLRVVVVDDHAMVTGGLAAVLPEVSGGDIEVVGTTHDAADVGRLVLETEPDVALIDLAMPPPGGIGAIRGVVSTRPATLVLAVSGTNSVEGALAALAAGARGFVSKSAGLEQLVDPIRVVASGQCVVPRELKELMVRAAVGPAAQLARNLDADDIRLLRLIAAGHSADEMAEQLFVSTRTLKRSLSALYDKLGVQTRSEAAAFAGRSGLLENAEPTPRT